MGYMAYWIGEEYYVSAMWGSLDHWGDNLEDLGLFPRHHTHVLVGMVRDQVPHNLVGSGKGWLYPLGGARD